MDYSIIGFPRIGIHRELKFATEAYFRSEIDADELKRVVSQQRMEQWTRQRDAGAGFIPSNDFSLYDGMLDKIPADHLWVNPDCGLKTRGETETVASLKNMVQAAKNIRNECKGDI